MGPGPPTSACWSREEDRGELCTCPRWPGAALAPQPPGEDGPISPPGAAPPQVLKANEGRAEHLYYIYFSIMAVVVLCAVDKGQSWPPWSSPSLKLGTTTLPGSPRPLRHTTSSSYIQVQYVQSYRARDRARRINNSKWGTVVTTRCKFVMIRDRQTELQ